MRPQPEPPTSPRERVPERVFLSDSWRDLEWMERVGAQLAPLVDAGTVDLWFDAGEIEPGDAFHRSIEEAIDTCSPAVLLVSPDFQASEFIEAKELPRLRRYADAGELRLFWIPVGHCVLADELGKTCHTVGSPGLPLEGCDRAEVNRILADLARKLRDHVTEARSRAEATRQAVVKVEEPRRAREAAAATQRAEREAAAERVRLAEEKAKAEKEAREKANAERRLKKPSHEEKKPLPGKGGGKWVGSLGKLAAPLVVGIVASYAITHKVLEVVLREREETVAKTAPLPVPVPVPAPAPSPATVPERRTESPSHIGLTNTLGMRFVPVPGTGVLFSVWETRVQDYAEYAKANSGVDAEWKDVTFSGQSQAPDHPVVNVSWEDAKATPGSKDMKIKDVYPWGTAWPPPQGAGNYGSITGYTDQHRFTAPVGSYAANKLGI